MCVCVCVWRTNHVNVVAIGPKYLFYGRIRMHTCVPHVGTEASTTAGRRCGPRVRSDVGVTKPYPSGSRLIVICP